MKIKNRIGIIISVVIIGGLVALGIYLNSVWKKPMGPSLSGDGTLPTTTHFSVSPQPAQASPQAQVTLPTAAPTALPLCGKKSTLTILLAGIDYRGDNYLYGLADVIRVVRIDFTAPKVVIFTIVRDLWVEIPGIQEHYGITHGLLNQSYFYGVPAMGYYDGPAGGAGLLARTLQQNFGLNVDNYLVVSMAAFVKGIDAIGGIDVYLAEPVDGRPVNGQGEGYFFPAGMNHLNGETALALARVREKYSSLVRITNQDAIIQGIYSKVKSPAIIARVPQLVKILQETVLTDLSPEQINSMYCLAKKMDASTLAFAEIPTGYYKESTIFSNELHQDIQYFDIDFNVIRSYVEQFQNGTWP